MERRPPRWTAASCCRAITARGTTRIRTAWTPRCSRACSKGLWRFAMDDEIRTERLLLRRATYDDAPAMHRIMTNPVAMRYWSTPPHQSFDETDRWISSMVEDDPSDRDDFIVTLDGKLIGKLGAWRLPEFGFLIDPGHWGKGYASEALAAFIERRRRLGSAELT